jgi:hypothetical protein
MRTTTETSFRKLLDFLDRLENAKIWYRMHHVRDSVMVEVAIPGERWEVEFFEEGHVEVERFVSAGDTDDESVLSRLFSDGASSG